MEERFFKFSLLSKFPVIGGISTRHYGDMRFGRLPDEEIIKNRQHFFRSLGIRIDDVVVARLEHGTKIATVGRAERGRGAKDPKTAIQQTDGLLTSQKGIYLMVTVADCLPIMVYDPVMDIVGVFHAGWRGIINQISSEIIEKFKNLGSEPANLVVTIGPGICQKHFVVKDEVLGKFKESYPKATLVRNQHGYVDLKKAVTSDFKKFGISKNNLEVSSDCPSCQNGIYGSFRKEGASVPASAVVIGMRK